MQLRDRIIGFRRVVASELLADERNPKIHPDQQKAGLRGILREVGIADVLLARQLPDGRLQLFDGHCRKDLDQRQVWPVVITDLTESEAAKIMATLDPLAAMAEIDADAMRALQEDFETDDSDLQAMLDELTGAGKEPRADRTLEEIDADTLPERPIWVLCTVPVETMPDAAPLLDQLALLGVTVEMSDGATRDG